MVAKALKGLMRQPISIKQGHDLTFRKKQQHYETHTESKLDLSATKSDRPLLRGKIHLLLIYTAPIWIFGLLRRCNTPEAFWTTLVAVTCALMNFTSSAVLHNFNWATETKKSLWRRVDYLCIFLMLTGSCMPVPVLLFGRLYRDSWVAMQIAFICLGVCLCSKGSTFNSLSSHTMRARAYVVMGLLNSLYIPVFYSVLSLGEFSLGLCMAALYLIGAAIYSTRFPDPWPHVFGYHELFHLCCLIAAVFTYIILASVVSRT